MTPLQGEKGRFVLKTGSLTLQRENIKSGQFAARSDSLPGHVAIATVNHINFASV